MSLENIFKNHEEPKLQNFCITTHITSTKFIFNYIYRLFFVHNFQEIKIKWFVWLNNTVTHSNFHFNIYSIVMSKRHHLHYIWRLRMFKCWRAKSEQEHPGGIHIFHLERHPREHIIAFSPSYWHSGSTFSAVFHMSGHGSAVNGDRWVTLSQVPPGVLEYLERDVDHWFNMSSWLLRKSWKNYQCDSNTEHNRTMKCSILFSLYAQ